MRHLVAFALLVAPLRAQESPPCVVPAESELAFSQADKRKLSWTRLLSESSGLANLARLNGIRDRLIYGGSDVFESRDYRFLGTIGLFDELYLPLKRGDNELWFAVTENFGGWGVKASFEDTEGIEVKE